MNEFWKILKRELQTGHQVMLMLVLHSEGSSPGRQGFKMLVSESSMMSGSIGGGIMEHKLVELCKSMQGSEGFKPFVKKQIHQDNISQNRSGLICSGEQTVAFYKLDSSYVDMVSAISEALSKEEVGVLNADKEGLTFQSNESLSSRFELISLSDNEWQLKEDLGYFPVLNIVGSGHVGLALSRIALQLGFIVRVYDDREGLNTMAQITNAECIVVDKYENISEYLNPGLRSYVVLMSFGYRTDKIILRKLLSHDFKYLGMMGSKKKVNRLFEELMKEGVSEAELKRIHAPIGLPIKSKTPEEIAVSILAEIIRVKNS